MDKTEALKQIDNFEAHYKYDSTFVRELLHHSPEGFVKYNNFLPLTGHREKLTPDEYWVAKLASMQVEDCGDCLQLNVRMAIEGGVSKSIIKAVLNSGRALPDTLKDVYDYAWHVASTDIVDPQLMERITKRYDKGSLLEFGLCIATAKVFPTIKRALGYTRSCNLVAVEV